MTKQDILKVFQFRHACKEFDPNKKVTKDDMDFILETARLSPSSFGIEPWHFIVWCKMLNSEKSLKMALGVQLKN